MTAHPLHLLLHLLDNHQQGAESEWAPFLQTLPAATLTPILWADEERQQLLRGSRVLQVRMQPGACTGDVMIRQLTVQASIGSDVNLRLPLLPPAL